MVLDLGAGTGTLVIYTGPERCGDEIEVSPAGGRQATTPRTHAEVRERLVRPRPRYAAVIAGLPAGRYTVWRTPDVPLEVVEVSGGEVTEYLWPGSVHW